MVGRIGQFSAAIVSVIGCHTFFRSPKEDRVVGTIDASGNSGAVIGAPSDVRVGEEFAITVTTRGDSCVRPDGADVELKGMIALVQPRDIRSYAHGCLEYDAPRSRAVKLRFSKPGTGVIRVRALNTGGEPVITERSVHVNP